MKRLRLYLITQDRNSNYDTYNAAIVAAHSSLAAREIHPDGNTYGNTDVPGKPKWDGSSWTNPLYVTVELVGYAGRGVKSGDVLCASYNAG